MKLLPSGIVPYDSIVLNNGLFSDSEEPGLLDLKTAIGTLAPWLSVYERQSII